jgi:hypothetical protein
MIINCGRRRIVSDRYGFTIEIKTVIQSGKREGQEEWKPDRPAYPATLPRALEVVYERTLADQTDEIDVTELCAACLRAVQCVHEYAREARAKGEIE